MKPCPFCGASNTYIESGLLDGRYSEEEWFQVQCQECCAVGSSRSAECDAVEAWSNAGSARAEAAEREVARVQTERERARVDACLMLSLAWATDAPMLIGACSINGMSTAEIDALRGLCETTIAADRPGDLLAAIRRVLHHEATAVRGSAACVAAVVAGRPAGEVSDG